MGFSASSSDFTSTEMSTSANQIPIDTDNDHVTIRQQNNENERQQIFFNPNNPEHIAQYEAYMSEQRRQREYYAANPWLKALHLTLTTGSFVLKWGWMPFCFWIGTSAVYCPPSVNLRALLKSEHQ